MSLFNVLLATHIAAGTIALTLFWIPLVSKKGGVRHRRIGWVYAAAMWTVAVTAWFMCSARLRDNNPDNDGGAIFLAYVGLLVANTSTIGIRVLRAKERALRHNGAFDIGFSAILVLGSVGLGLFGLRESSPLFCAFAILGILLSVAQLRYWFTAPKSRMHWWYEHLGNMVASCIGTVTAFLVVNVGRLGLQEYALAFWLAPGIVGGIGIARWKRHYRSKFEKREPARIQPAVQ